MVLVAFEFGPIRATFVLLSKGKALLLFWSNTILSLDALRAKFYKRYRQAQSNYCLVTFFITLISFVYVAIITPVHMWSSIIIIIGSILIES